MWLVLSHGPMEDVAMHGMGEREERKHGGHHEHERHSRGGHHREHEKEREEHEHRARGGEVHSESSHAPEEGLMNQEIDGDGPEHARGEKRGGATHPTHGGHRMAHGGHMMHNRGPHPGHGHPHHAKGGEAQDDEEGETKNMRDAHADEYNAQGTPAMKSATDQEPGFAEGGKAKRKRKHHRDGGHASGEMEHHRLDRRPRRAAGGRTEGGHNPYSSASKMESPEDTTTGRGYEGVKTDVRGTK